MKNNCENKARFFALYYGQRVLCIRKNESPELYVGFDDLQNNNVRAEDYLSLRPISSLTDEECVAVAEIFDLSKYQLQHVNVIDWVHKLFSNGEGYLAAPFQTLPLIDYLRSIGILIPFMGLSTETIIEYGWAKLKEE